MPGFLLDATDSEGDGPSGPEPESEPTDAEFPNDPFLQQYRTELYKADSETIDQMLALAIAIGNVI